MSTLTPERLLWLCQSYTTQPGGCCCPGWCTGVCMYAGMHSLNKSTSLLERLDLSEGDWGLKLQLASRQALDASPPAESSAAEAAS